MTILQDAEHLHNQAMDYTERALLAQRAGNSSDAENFFRQAFELESQAATLLADTTIEPSRSVLLRSAATLALDCDELREAEKLIATALAGDPPDSIAQELRNLLMTILPKLQHHALET